MRYELKYAVEMSDLHVVTSRLMMHPASFRPLFPDRKVNNIYLDTYDFHCFRQNIEGDPQRKKMRLRWYGSSPRPTSDAVLEIKNKDRELGWKDSFPLDGTLLLDRESLISNIEKIGILNASLQPVLYNSYVRSYYLSADGIFRLTIDREQSFRFPFAGSSTNNDVDYPIIIEIKYDAEYASRASDITNYIPFRQSKNSKYTTGINKLYNTFY